VFGEQEGSTSGIGVWSLNFAVFGSSFPLASLTSEPCLVSSLWLQNGENMDGNYDFQACIGLKVKPRKGDGLLFWSLTPNGSYDKVGRSAQVTPSFSW
jgi:hypothetical protein